jgi:single-stranded-DNA-specific exonuclease
MGTFIWRIVLLQWILAPQPDREILKDIEKKFNVSKTIATIFYNRGIRSSEDAKQFFKPSWDDLHDPYLMKDMDLAVDRILKAMKYKERVFIYGDYDVDGITATSLLYLFLKHLGIEPFYYIPDRLKEGYGLSVSGIQKAASIGATLVISVDCGITGVEEIAKAKELGIDFIVSDHHEPGERLPEAVAILDPKRKECDYPFKELAGVGVAYKFVQAVTQKLNMGEEVAREFIDLVALGSAADIVPMIDENRLIVKKGLEKINQNARHGINALAESSGLKGQKIGTGQIVFILAPRINAVGRLGNAERAVRLLITRSDQTAKSIACVLESENRNRKCIDEKTFQKALKLIESDFDIESDRAIVLAQEGWHSGVIGIVASRIAETFCRPTVMITIENGIGKGSARSISNFDIYSALKQCEMYLTEFGGHRYAAGLTIKLDKVKAFREEFQKVVAQELQDKDLVQKLFIDTEITLPEINEKFISILNRFAPFGPQNMRHVFLSHNLQVVGSPRIVGTNHLKFRVRQGGEVFDAIGFNLGGLLYRLTPGEESLDMVYVIEENYWDGQSKIQLRVKDLK